MFGAAIKHIIAIYGCNHDVVQAKLFDRIGHTTWFKHVQIFWWLAGCDIAECAGPRANLAHNHHRGVTLGPTFANIRTAGLFAHGGEFVFANDVARHLVALAGWRFDTNPVGLFGLRAILATLLFWVALGRNFQIAR
jgi:hypothetical protein